MDTSLIFLAFTADGVKTVSYAHATVRIAFPGNVRAVAIAPPSLKPHGREATIATGSGRREDPMIELVTHRTSPH